MEEYAELQALAAYAYGVTREEFERVLETFPLIEDALKRDAFTRFFNLGGRSPASTPLIYGPRRHGDAED